ncbi:hypothetical protein ES703_79422 [subsurface metagenome]
MEDKAVTWSSPKALITRKPAIRMTKYKVAVPIILETILSDNALPPTFNGIIALGLKASKIRRWIYFINTRRRVTFNAPPVEPAEAPIIISISKAALANDGQRLKLVVLKPVVVIMDTA